MASISDLSSERYEPHPRSHHSTAAVGRAIYLWGGKTKDFSKTSREKLSSVVETFDPYLQQWQQQVTKGAPPPGLYGGACASLMDSLYVCAGKDGSSRYNSLHQLNTATLEWAEPHQQNPQDGPMRKLGCRMVACNDDTLVLFGGYGIPSNALQSGSQFTKHQQSLDGSGWTNEFHLFNLRKGQWSSPSTTGTRPPPCAGFSFSTIDHHRAVLFGGQTSTTMTNDIYIIDLQAMHWTKVEKPAGVPWPVERVAHPACCLNYGQEHPQLLISGGIGRHSNVLGDVWLLDVDSMRWKQLSLPEDMPSTRAGHSITAVSLAPGLVGVMMYGGCPNNDPIAETSIVTLDSVELPPDEGRVPSKEWVLVGVARGRQLGLMKMVGEKMVRRSQRRASHYNQVMKERVMRAEREARDSTDALQRVQHSQQEAHRLLQVAQLQIMEQDQQLQERDQQIQEAQQRAELAEDRLEEAERRLLPGREEAEPFWVVRREEIKLLGKEEELGRGGWAVVKVVTFRGTRVAAKFLHGMIASNYNRGLFIREMSLASRVHHPNLLQFIGATLEGQLVILTELMPTNLRAVLEERAASNHTLSHGEVITISQDVARALNYLHLMKPDPIIHRDISSANVLLEPTPNNSWRAKISDYGSANFLQDLRTAGPGNPSYAAPEADLPAQQSTKMDIFSFGVLLIEMATCCFPDASSREHHIGSIHHPELVTLIRRCLLVDRNRRPSARELLAQLSAYV